MTHEKTEKRFATLLRRAADALEQGKPWALTVVDKRVTVPEDASVSVEHEVEGAEHCLELQFKWTKP